MAINVEVHGRFSKALPYPGIFVDEQEGLIVLLTGPGTGTVLNPGRSSYSVGYVGSYWKMERLVPFLGRLTMENK